nr:MAG TPA: hypothetical protein [Caudoviricetes sp.]
MVAVNPELSNVSQLLAHFAPIQLLFVLSTHFAGLQVFTHHSVRYMSLCDI